MALRLRGWKRRVLGICAGLLLCASVGCQNTKEERRPLVGQGGKPMGPGNLAATSPVYNNLAGNGPTISPVKGGTADNPIASGMSMPNIQPPNSGPTLGGNADNNAPQLLLPGNNAQQQGFAPNNFPVNQRNMPMPNQSNTGYPAPPMLPDTVNGPPLSSNGKMDDVKGPDLLPSAVMNAQPKLEAPSLLLPVSGMSDQLIAPGEPLPLKVISSGAKRLPEVKSSSFAPENDLVFPAPITVIK